MWVCVFVCVIHVFVCVCVCVCLVFVYVYVFVCVIFLMCDNAFLNAAFCKMQQFCVNVCLRQCVCVCLAPLFKNNLKAMWNLQHSYWLRG